jgi:hypothetical protein
MIMNVFRSNNKSLGALLLALAVSAMLAACSSTDEEAQDTGGGSGGSCENACMAAPSHQQDECLMGCQL